MRTYRRSAVLLLALGASLLLAASASAAGTLTYDGGTLVFTAGDGLSHEVQFRLSDDGNNDEIIDIQTIASAPGDCFYVVDPTWVSCPGHAGVRADLGAGNDTVTTAQDCFTSYTINLGDGANENNFNSGCPDVATATVNSGSGDDTLRGGSAGTTTTINAGGGADDVIGGDGNDVIHGGEGADELDGYAGNDQMFGEGGDDTIRGHAGNDVEDGGPGNDDIGRSGGISNDDDQGADDVRGGSGTDRLRLDAHSGGMTISLDDQANDGSPGEGDNIHSDIENIEGTGSDDSFTGSPGPDNFDGGNGRDTIHGADGDDTLTGGSDNDQVYGDAGNDTVYGSYGDDLVDGGPGRDSVFGDLASCSSFSCPAGNDQLFTRDGELDQANCGAGADTLQADQLDVFSVDGFQACESVDRQTVAVPGGGAGSGGGPAGGGAAFTYTIPKSIKLKALLKKGLVVRLKCARACKVVGTLSSKGKKLGSGRKTLHKAGNVRLAVKIGKKARAKVRRLRGKKLTLRVKVTTAGKTTTLTRKVKLKR
jgi:Ca2+-binding RTX toxin-like protein